jgi:NADPH:quinone reductase
MKAILVQQFGGPEVLTIGDAPDPVPGPGQVRVRLHACGVNPYDTYQLTGNYARKPQLPYVPGADGAGVIDMLGEGVTSRAIGDRVYIGGTVIDRSTGAYAEMAVCALDQVHTLPDRLSFAQGAAINVPYVTAWHAVRNVAQARPGETIFIHGASGAVGLAAVQIARAAGLTVIGSAGTTEGMAIVRAQGAHQTVNHRDEGYLAEVTAHTGGRGPDIIVEMLANENLDRDLGLAAPGGRIVIIGNRGRTEIDARQIMGKGLTVRGFALWNVADEDVRRIHDELAPGLASGALTPVVGTELPLADAPTAHTQVMAPGARGKIVLTIQ